MPKIRPVTHSPNDNRRQLALPKDEYNRLTSAAWHFRKANPGWNYAVRSEGNSVRIWRLSDVSFMGQRCRSIGRAIAGQSPAYRERPAMVQWTPAIDLLCTDFVQTERRSRAAAWLNSSSSATFSVLTT